VGDEVFTLCSPHVFRDKIMNIRKGRGQG
jgi:hypothetical protein